MTFRSPGTSTIKVDKMCKVRTSVVLWRPTFFIVRSSDTPRAVVQGLQRRRRVWLIHRYSVTSPTDAQKSRLPSFSVLGAPRVVISVYDWTWDREIRRFLRLALFQTFCKLIPSNVSFLKHISQSLTLLIHKRTSFYPHRRYIYIFIIINHVSWQNSVAY